MDNIATIYNMAHYILKVMHVEDDILNISHIVKNINSYPMEDKNHVDDSIMVLLY